MTIWDPQRQQYTDQYDPAAEQAADPDHEPDLMAAHVEVGVRVLHMTDADKNARAAEFGMSRPDYDEHWERITRQWTELDPDELTTEQYRRLFDRDKP